MTVTTSGSAAMDDAIMAGDETGTQFGDETGTQFVFKKRTASPFHLRPRFISAAPHSGQRSGVARRS
jgi:hypothetical protein